jgi:hypothetical protein
MDEISSVVVDRNSVLLNNGHLYAPQSISAPSDSSMSNSGIMETDHSLFVNCLNEHANPAPISNSGSLSFNNPSSAEVIESCIHTLNHQGLLRLSGSNLNLNSVETTTDSSIMMSGSRLGINSESSTLNNQGTLGGSGTIGATLNQGPDSVLMSHGETGVTSLQITGDMNFDGTVYFWISSRNFDDPEAYSVINSNANVNLSGGRACICINPSLVFEDGDRWDVMNAQTALKGTFDKVEFNCADCPRRTAKSIEATSASCDPTTDYQSRNFAVLFSACGSTSGNYFDSISPPWYVIFPVAIGIILFLIIFLGGALLIEGRYRKNKMRKKIQKNQSRRRGAQMSQVRSSQASSSMSSSMSSKL